MLIELWSGPLDGFVIETETVCDHVTGPGHVHVATMWGQPLAPHGGLAPVTALFEDAGTVHVHTMSCGVWRYRQCGYPETREGFRDQVCRFEFVPVEVAG